MIYDKIQAISVMNKLGAEGIPFVFLIDFEMKKIIISTKFENNTSLKFDMNDIRNHSPNSKNIQPSYLETFPIDKEKYIEQFQIAKSEIQRGNSFLLNLSNPNRIVTNLTLEEIYFATSAKYKVLLEDQFVCFSPEIFVQIKEGRIASYPMKGTIDANLPNAMNIILEDKKELAEHYTIVDLIRNDLSRVAKQVKVNRFRYIDRITTSKKDLLQISSEISGKLPDNYTSTIGSILFNLLPAGSISGAPKSKTIEVIQEAEGQERGYYTGVCGHFDGVNLDSGVMIRYIEKVNDEYYYRSGGGITSMSDADTEYQEMLDKVYLPLSAKVSNKAEQHRIANNEQ